MIISGVDNITSIIIVLLLFLNGLLIFLCVRGLGTSIRKEYRKNRWRKPKSKVDKSNYKRLHQRDLDEKKTDSRTELSGQSRIKSTSIIDNVLNFAKRNFWLSGWQEDCTTDDKMIKDKKERTSGKSKSKKGSRKKAKGKGSKHKKSYPFACGASNKANSDDEIAQFSDEKEDTKCGDIDTEAVSYPRKRIELPQNKRETDITDLVEMPSNGGKLDAVHRGGSTRRPDQQLYHPPGARNTCKIQSNKELQKGSTVVGADSSFERKTSEADRRRAATKVMDIRPLCPAEGEEGREYATDSVNRDIHYIQYECQNSDLDSKKDAVDSQFGHKRSVIGEFSCERFFTSTNGNPRTEKDPNNCQWQVSIESSKGKHASEEAYRAGFREDTKRIDCNGRHLINSKLVKMEVEKPEVQDINPQKLYLESDATVKHSDSAHLVYENIGQELIINSPPAFESIGIPILIDEYASKEWKGETVMAAKIRKGYSKVKVETGLICIRRVRGDNYCALRAVLFKTLSSGIDILSGISKVIGTITELPRLLLADNHKWIRNWSFANRLRPSANSVEDTLSNCLELLSKIVTETTVCLQDTKRYEMILDIMNKTEEDEVKIFEAVKFLMLFTSIQLYDKIQNKDDFDLLGALLFARDTSQDPESFMRNHLNCVGDTAGLDQLEMMLLGQTLNVVIKVFRLHRVDEDDFVVDFPGDLKDPEGTPILVAEDDRHYNVLCEEP